MQDSKSFSIFAIMENRKRVEVCFTPGEFDSYKGKFDIVVVIDVLRATSAICAAFDNGIKSIIPVATIEEARDYQNKGFLVGAERKGQIVEGFDFGNSPYSYMKESLKNKDVVLSTTNGTKALSIASEAPTVVVGSLLNLDTLNDWLLKQDKDILCLCSGWQDKFNLEDTICAGGIIDFLLSSGKFYADDDASIAAKYLFRSSSKNPFGFLKASSHRRRLKKLNLNKDIMYCLTPNTSKSIPILKDGKLVKI